MNMRKLFFILFFCAVAYGQNICGTSVTEDYLAISDNITNMAQDETAVIGGKTIKVPIAFHVLYDDSINISRSRLEKLVDHLTAAYRMRNTVEIRQNPPKFHRLAGDMNIEFYIDTVVRKKVKNGRTFSMSDEDAKQSSLGGSDPLQRMLNVWVCDLDEGLLGYAQFPGLDESTDGVCLDYVSAGVCNNPELFKYSEGDVLVHEVGHWLGLEHIWGDDCMSFIFGVLSLDPEACKGTDHVKDTPNQACPTLGCPTKPLVSCKAETMYMNYMDYTDNACMNMFTKGQVRRAHTTIKLYRKWMLYL